MTELSEYHPGNPNSGHGHVHPRPDKVVARCGGPKLCEQCARELAEVQQTQANTLAGPSIAVPESWDGNDAEAVGLAVAAAVAAKMQERDLAVSALHQLWAAFPETSWAGANDAYQRATDVLTELDGFPQE